MQSPNSSQHNGRAAAERGAALTMAMLVMALIAVMSITILSVVSNEARIAGGDLQHTRTFYAASAGLEQMTNRFSNLFQRTSKPSQLDMDSIAADPPGDLVTNEGFTFQQTLSRNVTLLNAMKAANGGKSPSTVIPNGPFSGMFASLEPYHLTTVATHAATKTQVRLERDVNNYMIPLFQFGMFSDKDLELHPGPAFVFNGRVHANGNIYVNGNVKFLDKVTTANELVYDVLRNGSARTGATVSMQVGSVNVSLTKSSVNNGPNLPGAPTGGRGYFPDSPSGTDNTTWPTTSATAAATGVPNKFGGQLLTRTTGAQALLLPLQLDGSPTNEIIKRALPADPNVLSESRYNNKAEVRVLIDDETGIPAGAPGSIPTGKGVLLSTWVPTRLGRKVLHRFDDAGNDIGSDLTQTGTTTGQDKVADAVRGANPLVNCGSPAVASAACSSSTVAAIPAGAVGLSGRIYIAIVPPSTTANPEPTPIDVTQTILSMGITEGEPNAIVTLQRPLWTAFMQGSRDGDNGNDYLTYFYNNVATAADGEIRCDSSTVPALDNTYGYLTTIQDDVAATVRANKPPTCVANSVTTPTVIPWNNIVPINLYNVREGYINGTLNTNTIYTRGITSIVEINMKNFARWVDGVYNNNLLAGTQAVNTNINGDDGYILYVSDRRGDRVKSEKLGTNVYNMTNGLVDNEDIYGPNNTLDFGEDVIDWGTTGAGVSKKGTLQKDTNELPDPTVITAGPTTTLSGRIQRAITVANYQTTYFRRGVRVINGETLTTSMTGTDKLSQTKGISVATENMLYVWGNYNTTGINNVPTGGASLAADYTGAQVPASLVSDAIFPLSKTWFDASPAVYPDDLTRRIPDLNLSGLSIINTLLGAETSVRAAVIAGTNLSAMQGTPDAGNGADSRLSGGVHNFPRFLEGWVEGNRRWNYLGSLVPMYYSTQALGPWQYPTTVTRVVYGAPIRNWAFDISFTDPNRLPPGTPQFQFVQATAFRETPCNGAATTVGCS